jgi:Uma2 family endonuclease
LIAGSTVDLITETTLCISVDEFREPDFLFSPRSIPLKDVTAGSALLIVEVADRSLRYDLLTKASAYVQLGLREYWVVDAMRLVTFIHRNRGGTAMLPHGRPGRTSCWSRCSCPSSPYV